MPKPPSPTSLTYQWHKSGKSKAKPSLVIYRYDPDLNSSTKFVSNWDQTQPLRSYIDVNKPYVIRGRVEDVGDGWFKITMWHDAHDITNLLKKHYGTTPQLTITLTNDPGYGDPPELPAPPLPPPTLPDPAPTLILTTPLPPIPIQIVT
jgi:hypothetical protein